MKVSGRQSRRAVLAGVAASAALPLAAAVPALAGADPTVALARAWEKARFGPCGDQSDEGCAVFIDRVLTPLEERMMATAPVSRDGAAAMLRAVEQLLDEYAAGSPSEDEEFNLALIANVRRALAEGRIA